MSIPWSPKSFSGVKLGLVANFAGTGCSAVVQVACIPFYIKFIGIEAYGLIGFYLTLQAVLQVLDLGLSPTMSREMARYSVQPEKAAEARDMVRTLEVGYWVIGIVIGVTIVLAAQSIATHWIKAGSFPIRAVRQTVMVMGILAFFQWPISFYQGGLMGLGRQVLYNTLKISMVTLTHGGAVLILWLVSPTIQAFFLWLAAVNGLQVICLAVFLWKNLPPAPRAPRLDLKLVRGIGSFAAGMSGITAFSLILGQADKVILSTLFSLRVFGYYTLAGVFGTGLSMIVGSVFNTIYPRFSALVAMRDEETLKNLYHRCTQLMSVLVLPLAAVLALFSTDILQLWTRNSEVARNAGPIAALLVIGAALNGVMNLPYALQLAYGWTSIGLYTTISLTIVVVPAIWFMAARYGPVGAAFVWVGLQAVNMLVGVPLTHRRLLRREMGHWFLRDVGPSLVAVLLLAGLARSIISSPMRQPAALLILSIVFLAALLGGAFAARQVRLYLLEKFSRLWLGFT
jgi:O-antigen/teichoic acid export membrane protein